MSVSGVGVGIQVPSANAERQAHSIMSDNPEGQMLQPQFQKLLDIIKKMGYEMK